MPKPAKQIFRKEKTTCEEKERRLRRFFAKKGSYRNIWSISLYNRFFLQAEQRELAGISVVMPPDECGELLWPRKRQNRMDSVCKLTFVLPLPIVTALLVRHLDLQCPPLHPSVAVCDVTVRNGKTLLSWTGIGACHWRQPQQEKCTSTFICE